MGCPRFLRLDMQSVAIASSMFASSLLATIFRFYYVRAFLEHNMITQKWLNIAQLTYIVVNTVFQPVIGFCQDFGCKRFCRNRRRMILFGGPLFALAFLSPWFPWYDGKTSPAWVPGLHLTGVLFLWAVFYILVFSAYGGLYAEQSVEHEYRVRLFKYEALARLVGSTVVFPVDKLSHSMHDWSSFQWCCVGVSGFATLGFIFTGFGVRDQIAQQRLSEEGDEEDPVLSAQNPVIEAFKVAGQVIRNKNFLCAVSSNFTGALRIQILFNFAAIYVGMLVTHKWFPPGSFQLAAFFALCPLLPLLVLAGISPLTKRFGTHFMLQSSFVLTWLNSAAALLLQYAIGYNVLIINLLIESILAAFQSLYRIVLSEVIDEDTRLHNRRLPISALILTLKDTIVRSSLGFAPIIVVQLLNIDRYSEFKNSLPEAPNELRYLTFMIATCLPAALALIGFLCLFPYKIGTGDAVAARENLETSERVAQPNQVH